MIVEDRNIHRIDFENVLNRLPFVSISDNAAWKIERFDDLINRDSSLAGLGKADHYVLCWAKRGCGRINLRFKNEELSEARLYLLKPGTVYRFMEFPVSGWLLRFRPHYLSRTLPDRLQLHFLNAQPYVELTASQLNELDDVANLLYHTDHHKPNPYLITNLISLSVEMASAYYRSKNNMVAVHPHEKVLSKLLDLVDKHFRSEKWPSFYAGRLGVVERKLNDICTKGTGYMVVELIEDRKLSEAEALLATTKLLIKTIADELGFINGNHFAHWFWKRRGLRPLEFRALTLNDTSWG